ncbi:hypothetical protein MNV49_007913 [Pseudohyphozyma bogoriensis]|nr:hypothetical protein MNV49_007913 [Pseudohyphozyma bogoriensis]
MSSWSRLVRFLPADAGTTPLIGEPVDAALDVGLAIYEGKQVEVELFDGSSVLSPGTKTGEKAIVGKLLSPVSEEEVGTIRCVGLNYRLHAKELNLVIPDVPTIFMKPAESLANPYPDPIVIPKFLAEHSTTDYESEFGIIIGKACKNVSEAEALDYVLGYTACNDVSNRKTQMEQSQWGFSKGFDKACPCGPVIVNKSQIPDASKLFMTGHKNGKLMQTSQLDDMIFTVAQMVSFISQGTTLKPGTLIITGTPHGIGHSHSPPEYLVEGDEYHVNVSGGIGTLINKTEVEK